MEEVSEQIQNYEVTYSTNIWDLLEIQSYNNLTECQNQTTSCPSEETQMSAKIGFSGN